MKPRTRLSDRPAAVEKRFTPAVSFMLAVGFCCPAWAQGTAADKAAAEALFAQGQQLLDQERISEACEKFRASQQLDAGLGTMLYLADCYEQSGRTASAWATFEEAASVAASRGERKREEIARVRADALKPRLSHIIIEPPASLPSNSAVTRDGSAVPPALFGVAIPVDPGVVTVEVSATGYHPVTLSVQVPKQTSQPVRVTIPSLEPSQDAVGAGPSAPVATSPAPLSHDMLVQDEPSSRLPTEQTAGLVLGGVGIVAAGLATVFTVMGSSTHDDSLDHCSERDGNSCDPEGVRLREQAFDELGVATVFGVIGAAALGTGLALYVAFPSAEPNSHSGIALSYSGAW